MEEGEAKGSERGKEGGEGRKGRCVRSWAVIFILLCIKVYLFVIHKLSIIYHVCPTPFC